jgi:signal transduction histidine kinase
VVLESVLRDTLATVEAQRDDALAYLGTIRSVLGALRRMTGLRACAREVASILTRELHAESCAILARGEGSARSTVIGFATQAEGLGGPAEPYGVEAWIELADRVPAGEPLAWLQPSANGGWEPLRLDQLAGESFEVIPFTIGDERRGTIVLHRLVALAHRFAGEHAMPLIASAIGEALTIAQTRDAASELTEKLAAELGVTRGSLESREQTLLERERTIARLTDAVLQSNRAKREFLSVISHELRTPLNAIVGFASLLDDDFATAGSDEHREMLHGILDRAHHLTSLIEDVLLYVDLDAGRARAAREPLALRPLIDDVVAAVEREHPRRFAVEIDVDPRAEQPCVDAPLVRRVLFHLVDNAYKFTSGGRVTVRARACERPGTLELLVEDTGEGMPQLRIVEPAPARGPGSRPRAGAARGRRPRR